MSRESILPQLLPNPIPGFKDQCLAPFVGMLSILTYLPFNLLLDVVVQVLIKEAFSKPSLHNTSSSIGIRRRSRGVGD